MDVKNIEVQDADIIENAIVGLREVWRKKLFVLLITVAGILFSLIYVSIFGNTIQYYSSATLFSAVYGSYSATTEGVAAMNRYTDLISSSRVCSRAAQELTMYNITAEDLRDMAVSEYIRVTGANSNSSAYGYKLTIATISDSSEQAIAITNAMASAFAAELNDLLGTSTIQVMDEATRYRAFRSMNVLLYLVLFGGGAFAVSAGSIFCMGFFSPWARSVSQCEREEELILGLLPYSNGR